MIKMDNDLHRRQIVSNKLEGLIMARQATINEDDGFKFNQLIKHYKREYKQITGIDYEYLGDKK